MLVSLAALVSSEAAAKEAAPLAEDPAVEQRLVRISEELRCLVCQNESLAGSRADLAQDLRREIRDLIRQGKTDQEIRDFMVNRYGDFVLYRPPVKPMTWFLWAGPFALMVIGLVVLVVVVRRRKSATEAVVLTDQQRQRAKDLLGDREP